MDVLDKAMIEACGTVLEVLRVEESLASARLGPDKPEVERLELELEQALGRNREARRHLRELMDERFGVESV